MILSNISPAMIQIKRERQLEHTGRDVHFSGGTTVRVGKSASPVNSD